MPFSRFVVTDATGILGHMTKETAEIGRAVVDFRRWLDDNELIGLMTRFSLNVTSNSPESFAWQADYPFDNIETPTPTDTYPLVLSGVSTSDGKIADILFGAGTPGLTYVASFMVVAARSGRWKQINILVTIPEMVNPAMVSSIDPTPSGDFAVVTTTTALPSGTVGTIYVQNADNAPITITLPPGTNNGQRIRIIDAAGNASLYTIHVEAYGGAQIIGQDTYDLAVDNQAADFDWIGTEWVVS